MTAPCSVQFFYADPYHSGRVLGVNPSDNPATYQAYVVDGANSSALPAPWRCINPQPTNAAEFITSMLFSPRTPIDTSWATFRGVYRSDTTRSSYSPAACQSVDTAGDAIYTSQPLPKSQVVAMALDPADERSFYLTHQRTDEWRVVHVQYQAQSNQWTAAPIGIQFPASTLD